MLGYRPCRRCRPELSPGTQPAQDPLTRTFRKVQSGYLEHKRLTDLANDLDLSPRQLSRLFVQRFGATPTQIHATQRLLFARRLLKDSNLPITQIAFASGFSSLRRFNDAFSKAYAQPPSQIRRNGSSRSVQQALTLQLHYRPPLAFSHTLDWLQARLINGVEAIEDGRYLRVLAPRDDGPTPWFSVGPSPKVEHALELCAYDVEPEDLRALMQRVRRMFDLDAHPQAIAQTLSKDPRLYPWVKKLPGLRIPGAWDGFETAMRAIIGQQVSVAAAHTITQRVMQRVGIAIPESPHPALTMHFPGVQAVLRSDLTGLGLTQRRIDSIFAVGEALLSQSLSFETNTHLEDWIRNWTSLPGIGPWTASYLALRVLNDPDVFPGGDLVLRKAMANTSSNALPTPTQARREAEKWRPWRSYAAFYLWHIQSTSQA